MKAFLCNFKLRHNSDSAVLNSFIILNYLSLLKTLDDFVPVFPHFVSTQRLLGGVCEMLFFQKISFVFIFWALDQRKNRMKMLAPEQLHDKCTY